MKPQTIPELAQYIQQQQQRGRSDAVIRNELAQRGWSESGIDDAYQLIWQQTSGRHYLAAEPTPAAGPVPVSASGSSKKKRLIIGVGIILAVPLVFIIAIVALSSGPSGDNAEQTGQQNEAAQAQQARDDANRQHQQDVDAIAGGIKSYMESHSSSYPLSLEQGQENDKTLLICGENCDGTTDISVRLESYKPANIELKTYSGGLAAPKPDQAFVVTNAVCNAKKDWIDAPAPEQDTATTVALLHTTQTDSGTKRQCTPL